MKARKLPLILLCGAVLTGCAEKSSESIVKPDEPQLAAVQPTTEAPSIKDEVLAMIADSGENFIHFDFTPKGSSFTVSYKGTEFFTIDAGRPVDESDKIKVADYNFDGYDDIFIPDEETSFGHVLGDYYLCDPQTLDFGKSEELGVFFGRGTEMKADLTYKRLIMEYTERTSEFIVKDCALNYVWEGGRLVPHSLTKKYENADSIATAEEMFTDTYEFEDGRYEVLKERRVFKNQSNDLLRTEENVGYVRVTDSAVQYMKGGDVVQEIPVSDIHKKSAFLRCMDEAGQALPVLYSCIIKEEDYDFDGHSDLRVYVGEGGKGVEGKADFYRYDAESDSYKPWDELNSLNADPEVDRKQKKTLTCVTSSGDENIICTQTLSYQWDNGSLKPVQRVQKITIYDENGDFFHSQEDTFMYDEHGEEYKIKAYIPPTVSG